MPHDQDIAIPQLPSRSLESTLAFYRSFGFSGDVVDPARSYAVITRGTLEIHFFLHPRLRPAESAFGCCLRVQDVDATYRAFAHATLPTHGIPRLEPPANKPWGMREFAIVDEDGSLVRVGQEL